MLPKKLKTLLFAAAVLSFTACDDDSATGPDLSKSGTGTIEFAILGEDIPYHNLEFEGNLKSAKITYAYMLIKDPTLNGDHRSRHAGETLEGTWAVDLMDATGDRKPVHLGYIEADTGLYNGEPEITLPAAPTDDVWSGVVDKGGLTKLKEGKATFLFGGTFIEADGTEHTYEIREPLFPKSVAIKEFPTATNGEAGTKLHVPSDDTLLAEFHPHIDHALEVLDENPIDYANLEKENGVIIISDTKNTSVKDKQGTTVELYNDIVQHIIRGDHWDVNVIPGHE